MYFNYHAKLKRLIESGHAEFFEFCENYHGIGKCIIVHFNNSPPMPVRPHRFEEYLFLFAKFGVEERKKQD